MKKELVAVFVPLLVIGVLAASISGCAGDTEVTISQDETTRCHGPVKEVFAFELDGKESTSIVCKSGEKIHIIR